MALSGVELPLPATLSRPASAVFSCGSFFMLEIRPQPSPWRLNPFKLTVSRYKWPLLLQAKLIEVSPLL